MPSCLYHYMFFQSSLFPFFDEPSSLFILHKSPQSSQNSSSASFSISLTEIIMVFSFFLGVKNSCRALHSHRAMVAPFFFFSFFFPFFFCQKKFPRSSHCWKETFAWNYLEHWCEFNIWQNVMVEASTMVIWCCESVMFLFFLKIKIALAWTAKIAHGSQNRAVGLWFVWVPAFFAWSGFWC